MIDEFVELGFDAGFDIGAFDVGDMAAPMDLDLLAFDDLGWDIGHLDLNDVDVSDLDLAGELALDLDFTALGVGSDLDDVVFALDAGDLVDWDLTGPGLALDGDGWIDMAPEAAIGTGVVATPFLPTALGGAPVAGGGFLYPIDTFQLVETRPAGGRVVRRIGRILAQRAATTSLKRAARARWDAFAEIFSGGDPGDASEFSDEDLQTEMKQSAKVVLGAVRSTAEGADPA